MSRVRVDLRARETPSRCALCHEAGGALLRCEGCGALTHEVCRDEIGRTCPTLGCRPVGDLTVAQITSRVEGMGWWSADAHGLAAGVRRDGDGGFEIGEGTRFVVGHAERVAEACRSEPERPPLWRWPDGKLVVALIGQILALILGALWGCVHAFGFI